MVISLNTKFLMIFAPPIFKNSELNRVSRIFFKLIWGFIFICSFTLISSCIVLPQNTMRWLSILIVFDTFCFIILLLNKKGFVKLASYSFVYFALMIIFAVAWSGGGIKSPILQAIPAIVLVSGFLLGWKNGLISAVVGIVGGLVLVVAQVKNILPPNTVLHHPFSLWINGVAWISILSLMQFLFMESLNKALLNAIKELTVRKKAEKELIESQELFKTLIKYAPHPTVLTDIYGKVVLVNDAYLETINLSEEQLIGRKYNEIGLNWSDDLQQIIMDNAKSAGRIDGMEMTITSDGGVKTDYLYSCRIIKWGNEPHILNSLVDITHKNSLERELEKYRNHLESLVKVRTEDLAISNTELSKSNELLSVQKEELLEALNKLNDTQKSLVQSEKMASLGLLAAGIAHEINNPLNFINGGILAIEEQLRATAPNQFETISPLINAIHTGVSRATAIVKSLNTYSRTNDLPQEVCSINNILDNCLLMLHGQFKSGVEVTKNYATTQYSVLGNEGKLHQAFLNIISNAVQSIDEVGVISITTELSDGFAHITIADTGHGITPENLKKIFDPFFTTKAPGNGTGLGLSITYNIIQEHNGSITLESTPNMGTITTIKLPIILA